jgi:hypothetical protein
VVEVQVPGDTQSMVLLQIFVVLLEQVLVPGSAPDVCSVAEPKALKVMAPIRNWVLKSLTTPVGDVVFLTLTGSVAMGWLRLASMAVPLSMAGTLSYAVVFDGESVGSMTGVALNEPQKSRCVWYMAAV